MRIPFIDIRINVVFACTIKLRIQVVRTQKQCLAYNSEYNSSDKLLVVEEYMCMDKRDTQVQKGYTVEHKYHQDMNQRMHHCIAQQSKLIH